MAKARKPKGSDRPRRKRSKPATFERRAWGLVGLRRDVKLVHQEDHVSIEAPRTAPIHVFEEHTVFLEPTSEERRKVRSTSAIPVTDRSLRIPAGYRLEKQLVAERLGTAPPRSKPGQSGGTPSYDRRQHKKLAEERRRKSRRAAAVRALIAAAPILRAAGVDAVSGGESILVRDGTFNLEELRVDGGFDMKSRYTPAMRFVGMDTVFEKPNKAELAAVAPPATRHGSAIHAPVGSDVWRVLLQMRASRAKRARQAAEERGRHELEARHQEISDERAKRDAALREAKKRAPAVAARLAQQLSNETRTYALEDSRIYLDDVPVGQLVLDPVPHIRIFDQSPLSISGTAVVPRQLSEAERAWLLEGGADGRRSVLMRIVQERFRDSREHALASVQDAHELLVELGVQPEQTRDGLCVAGELEVPFGAHVHLDRLKASYCARVLFATVEEHLGNRIPGLAAAQDGPGAVEISVEGRVLARIDAFGATINGTNGGHSFPGNFLLPGRQWSLLLKTLGERFTDIAMDRVDEASNRMQTITEVPAGIPASLAERCLEASCAIRTRRNAAFGNPVTLSTAGRTAVTFLPVRDDGEPYVPIIHDRGATTVRCHLRLSGSVDPLPLVIRGDSDDLAGIWVLSLLGFATLTVVPELHHEPRTTRTPRARSPRDRAKGREYAYARSAGMRYVSSDLEPTGITRTAHWVVGHIRLLRDGQTHTPQAAQEARKQGITLRDNQTWVRPHVRGLSSSEPLTFRWRLPHEALSLVP